MVNPTLRAQLSGSLDDEVPPYVAHYESWCVDEESTTNMINTITRSLTRQLYRSGSRRNGR
ncbi:hypothetical protein AWC27_13990 [Mycobacterium szulgai]|uniref:Uncharacterized protein n=1 Tax=Mycobacterium szulgai TaxID=1787 RepID=A0A1X2DKR2_MYCSZ|nr:hypothetical protein AWC27_13990 [Mycobacterium szulgai]